MTHTTATPSKPARRGRFATLIAVAMLIALIAPLIPFGQTPQASAQAGGEVVTEMTPSCRKWAQQSFHNGTDMRVNFNDSFVDRCMKGVSAEISRADATWVGLTGVQLHQSGYGVVQDCINVANVLFWYVNSVPGYPGFDPLCVAQTYYEWQVAYNFSLGSCWGIDRSGNTFWLRLTDLGASLPHRYAVTISWTDERVRSNPYCLLNGPNGLRPPLA